MKFAIDEKFITKFPRTPLGAFDFFKNSYVRFNPDFNENDYSIHNNIPYISVNHHGPDVPLFHEIGHFLVAPISRLHLPNYGYANQYTGNKWHDLNIEIQVDAIETNLLKKFRIEPEYGYGLAAAAKWNYLPGWHNYRYVKKLTEKQMIAKVAKRIKYWQSVYGYYWIDLEWRKRNVLLRSRARRNGHINIPHELNYMVKAY
jgi:hypothetical protein